MAYIPKLTDLTARDFPLDSVDLKFEDNSTCHFNYAFYQIEGNYLVVYTEHCGYFAFDKNIILEVTGKQFNETTN